MGIGPLKYKSAQQCPARETHSDNHISPTAYLGWMTWAEEMSKTHKQQRCPVCGFWAIWVPKTVKEE